MDFSNIFITPARPKLKFGEPLDVVCENGIFHAGLKDLFLKAYLSARGDEDGSYVDPDDNKTDKTTSAVLSALKSGSKGQGSLSRRISLKTKLETGEWLVHVQTPAGAPLWLLRHFLGRLPEPLLKGSQWKILGGACGAALAVAKATAAVSGPDAARTQIGQVLERIAVSTRTLSRLEFETLALLALLIRNLSSSNAYNEDDDEELTDDALNGLSQYFIASIIARPFRPGLYTAVDKASQPLLIVLAKYWRVIFQEADLKARILQRPDNGEMGRDVVKCVPGESRKYFRDDYSDSRNEEKANRCKFIGFETMLIIQDHESRESSDNDIDTKRLRKRNAFDDLNAIKNDLTASQANSMKNSQEKVVFFENTKARAMLNEAQTPSAQFVEESNVKYRKRNNNITSTSFLEYSEEEISILELEIEKGSRVNCKTQDNADNAVFLNEFANAESLQYSNPVGYKFFSVPNSEDSQ